MGIRNLFFVFALFSLLSIISLACGGNESEEENYDRGQTRDFKPPPSAHYGESGSKVSPAGTEGGNKFFDPSAKKEKDEIINDLIIAAYNDAKEKLKKKTSEELLKITGGINLPFDFKLPS